MDYKITNTQFKLIRSIKAGYKEIYVSFLLDGKEASYFIFIKEGKNVDYINEAKKQFEKDVKSGEVFRTIKDSSNKRKPLLITAIIVLAAGVITLGSLFTYKAITSNVHTVSFETNGGSHVDSIKVRDGSKITQPDNPIKTNYSFDGWYIDASFEGDSYNFDTPVTKDITLYAQWLNSSDYALVTFNAGEGNLIEGSHDAVFQQYIRKGTTFENAFADLKYVGAIKDDSSFLYWTINGEKIKNNYPITENVEFEPKYAPLKDNCLTFTARVDGVELTFASDIDLQYSNNGSTWQPTSSPIVLENAGDQVYIKRDVASTVNGSIVSADKHYAVSGSIESLINMKTGEDTPSEAFSNCFANNTNLVSAANLEIQKTTMSHQCFYMMFFYCQSLIAAPKLPAESLAENCYEGMFSYCSSLVMAPELPATDLTGANGCYTQMFTNCSRLIAAPDLPATKLSTQCYINMFVLCSSLTIAPALPATELAEACYQNMFMVCRSLTIAPDLPATNLKEMCYFSMFNACTSLTSIPSKLPAINLKPYCYYNMFAGCSSLTTAPELPAEALVGGCYTGMFANCASLKIREETGSTTGANKIFTCPSSVVPGDDTVSNMFENTAGTFTDRPTAGNSYYWY